MINHLPALSFAEVGFALAVWLIAPYISKRLAANPEPTDTSAKEANRVK